MKVFVIGGTRFIGLFAVQALLADGHEVTIFNRNGPRTFEGQVEWKQGDRNDVNVLRDAIRESGPDVILDMIALVESHGDILVKAAGTQVSRIVTASSMDVYQAYGVLLGIEPDVSEPLPTPLPETSPLRTKLYPYRGPEPRAEDDPAKLMDTYDKILVEQKIMNAPGIRGTVIRLPIVYGPYDGQHRMFEFLKRMLDRRPAILLNEHYAHWRTSRGYAANMGRAIADAVGNDAAAGEIFNIAEEPAWSTLEWVHMIAGAVGWKGKVVLTGAETTPKHLNVGMNAAQNLVADSTKIRETLGYSEPVDRARAILRTAEWETANMPKLPPERLAAMFDYEAEDTALAAI